MAGDALLWWNVLDEGTQGSWKLLRSAMLLRYRLRFAGRSGGEAEDFVDWVRQRALDLGKLDDAQWTAKFASGCFVGSALRWYMALDPEVRGDWNSLQQAIFAQYGQEFEESSSIIPTPAPAAAALVTAATPPAVGPPLILHGLPLPEPTTPTPSTPMASTTRVVPPLSTEDRNKYTRVFLGRGPQNGVLTGDYLPSRYSIARLIHLAIPADKAKEIFSKSKLPMETLALIWDLADTQYRGVLDQTDFIIGMFFIELAMSQPGFVIPTTLPPGLYEQANGTKSTGTHQTSGPPTGPGSPVPRQPAGQPLQPRYTGQTSSAQHTGQNFHSSQLTGPSSKLSMTPSVPSPAPTSVIDAHASGDWDISTQEKATADSFFATLDTQRRGYIEGDVAVPFMLQSGLPEEVLAQIWDLTDLHKDGRLTQEGFAIAMHLIKGKLAGKEVPETLPFGLIPPAMRTQSTPQLSIQQDLSLLGDSPPPSASAPITVPPRPTSQRLHILPFP
ncbi:hypothetical protein FRC05_007021 [Tulasnella sp. 425]|nr:hypothetical protein FRC05_007021 [Tulasnella sp. 425]